MECARRRFAAQVPVEPSLNINGMISGHAAEGMKTLLPHEARAKIDVRLVPNMEPERVLEQVRRHLDAHGYQHIEILPNYSAYPWLKADFTTQPTPRW